MKVFIDTESLSSVPVTPAVLDKLTALVAAEYPKDEILFVQTHDRVRVLAMLVEGAGAAVVTGPSMLPFWSAVSIEVQVWVQPDGYLSRRRTSGMQWALESEGLLPVDASRLIKTPPKSTVHQHMAAWDRANFLVGELRGAQRVLDPLVEGQLAIEILKEDEALEYVRGLADTPHSDEDPVALDFEYNKDTLEPHGLNIAHDSRFGGTVVRSRVYIPFMAKDYTAPEGFALKVLQAVEELHDKNVYTVYHNGKSDLFFVGRNTGRDPLRVNTSIHDTIVMAYVAGDTELGLKELTPVYLGREAMEYPGNLAELPVALAARYGAGGDANNTLDLYHVLRAKLINQKQWDVYTKVEQPIIPLVASMEWNGHRLSIPELYRVEAELVHTLNGLAQHVWAKHRLDLWKDGDQLLFATRMLGYNPGTVSNDKLAPKSEDAWLDTLIGFRKLRHRLRAFVWKHIDRWKEQGYPDEYYSYSSFNQAGSADERDERSFTRAPRTGRFSSSAQRRGGKDLGDNLQNQPGEIRAAYIAPKGYKVFSYDHTALEMNIAAAVSGDPEMLGVLTEVCPSPGEDGECPHLPKHGDPHGKFQYAAKEITGVDVGRTVAKNWNFGMNYDAGVDTQLKTLAKVRAFIPYDVAQKLHKAHHEVYAVYHESNAARQEEAVARGYSITEFGRRRYDADLASPDNETRRHGMRAAGNMGVQGTAADLIKIEMGELVPLLLETGARITAQVHDELVGIVPAVNEEWFDREARRIMGSHNVRGLPIKVAGGISTSWGGAH